MSTKGSAICATLRKQLSCGIRIKKPSKNLYCWGMHHRHRGSCKTCMTSVRIFQTQTFLHFIQVVATQNRIMMSALQPAQFTMLSSLMAGDEMKPLPAVYQPHQTHIPPEAQVPVAASRITSQGGQSSAFNDQQYRANPVVPVLDQLRLQGVSKTKPESNKTVDPQNHALRVTKSDIALRVEKENKADASIAENSGHETLTDDKKSSEQQQVLQTPRRSTTRARSAAASLSPTPVYKAPVRKVLKVVIWEKPKNINFTQGSIRTRFHDGRSIYQTLNELDQGVTQVRDIPKIWLIRNEKDGSLWSLNNRRLHTFKQFCPDEEIEVYLLQDPAYVIGFNNPSPGKGVELVSPRCFWTAYSKDVYRAEDVPAHPIVDTKKYKRAVSSPAVVRIEPPPAVTKKKLERPRSVIPMAQLGKAFTQHRVKSAKKPTRAKLPFKPPYALQKHRTE